MNERFKEQAKGKCSLSKLKQILHPESDFACFSRCYKLINLFLQVAECMHLPCFCRIFNKKCYAFHVCFWEKEKQKIKNMIVTTYNTNVVFQSMMLVYLHCIRGRSDILVLVWGGAKTAEHPTNRKWRGKFAACLMTDEETLKLKSPESYNSERCEISLCI